jgi:chemotaxis protein CheX
MDDAVEEVFLRMLERPCTVTGERLAIPPDISARINFSGALEAHCIVEFPSTSAQRLTLALLGDTDAHWDDAVIADAVGEFCNMVAGGWKQRLGPHAWQANLSVPSISRSPDRTAPAVGATTLRRAYAFDDSPFLVSLTLP